MDGTVCGSCIRASKYKPEALNPELVGQSTIWSGKRFDIDEPAALLRQAD